MNILSTFTTIKAILELTPVILQLVKTVESQIPESGKGREKLNFVLSTLEASFPYVKEMTATVEKIITATVSLYNSIGTFKR